MAPRQCYFSNSYSRMASNLLPINIIGAEPRLGGNGGLLLTRRVFNSNSWSKSGGNRSRSSFFEWYSNKLDTHPIMTKCVSAGIIASVGNVFAQKITHVQDQNENKKSLDEPFRIDAAQVGRFALLNVVFVAPVLHHWYQFINKTVPGTSVWKVWQRTILDEFVFSPVYIPVFLGMLWKLEGNSNERIWKMTKSEVPGIIVAEWVTWVPTMFVTFRYVPVKFQVLVINTVGVVWQTFLAYMANNAHSQASQEEAMEETVADRAERKVVEDDRLQLYFSGPVTTSTSTAVVNSSAKEDVVPPPLLVEGKLIPSAFNTIDDYE